MAVNIRLMASLAIVSLLVLASYTLGQACQKGCKMHTWMIYSDADNKVFLAYGQVVDADGKKLDWCGDTSGMDPVGKVNLDMVYAVKKTGGTCTKDEKKQVDMFSGTKADRTCKQFMGLFPQEAKMGLNPIVKKIGARDYSSCVQY